MAYESSSKARLLSELSRSRHSSPCDENVFTTATGTSFHDVLHSTPLREPPQSQPTHPLNYDSFPDPSDRGSDESMEMSVEIGRGIKRRQNEDPSSEGIFKFGNEDSHYELSATPPIPIRSSQRKPDGLLRREASVRRATESIKANDSLKRTSGGIKARATSEMLPKVSAESDDSHNARDFAQIAPLIGAKNTRFLGSRQPSITGLTLPTRFVAGRGLDADDTRQRTANLNGTVQSATFTANQSFMLPDIPDITELVSGVRKDGTPVFNRNAKSRSRFTSALYKPQSHRAVESLPLPNEEKVILASLQVLKDRISELEAENGNAQKRADQFESEVIDLRNRLSVTAKVPQSEDGSDDETLPAVPSSKAAHKLQASLNAVQERFNRSERKVATAQISMQRVVKERDALISQIAVAYYNNEEVVRENDELRENQVSMLAENNDLKDQVQMLKTENERLKAQMEKGKLSYVEGDAGFQTLHDGNRKTQSHESTDEKRAASQEVKRRPETGVRSRKTTVNDSDIASKIEREVQRYREEAATKIVDARSASTSANNHPRSASRQRAGHSTVKRNASLRRETASAPATPDFDEVESTTELNLSRKSQQKHGRVQTEIKDDQENNDQDITVLSDLDDDLVARLRKSIEEEHRARRLQKQTSMPETSQSVRRKSSLKDTNGDVNDGTGRFSLRLGLADDATRTGKTVRVQSPHTTNATIHLQPTEADTGDVSILSNISRRRRSTASEGMTSAFIIPDITLHHRAQPLSAQLGQTCIPHDASNCTVCQPSTSSISIPTPIPVSDREIPADATDMTVRPAQSPALALATVIKLLEDEITHLKLQREAQNRLYNQHDPAISKRRRALVHTRLQALTAEIEKRSDQVYALYDALEGQKMQAETQGGASEVKNGDELVEETLMSVGIDPAELSGRVGRSAVAGFDGADEWSEDSEELPWEGLSDVGSE